MNWTAAELAKKLNVPPGQVDAAETLDELADVVWEHFDVGRLKRELHETRRRFAERLSVERSGRMWPFILKPSKAYPGPGWCQKGRAGSHRHGHVSLPIALGDGRWRWCCPCCGRWLEYRACDELPADLDRCCRDELDAMGRPPTGGSETN